MRSAPLQCKSEFQVEIVRSRQGKLFDPTNNRSRKNRPEEHVRSGVIRSLQKHYGFVREQISTEEPLYARGKYRYRADVVLWEDDQQERPIAVIELKARGVALDDAMSTKLRRYAACMEPSPQLLVLSNGSVNKAAVMRHEAGDYLAKFPTAKQIANGLRGLRKVQPWEPFRRPGRSAFTDQMLIVRRRLNRVLPEPVVASQVAPEVARPLTEFGELLRDDSVDLAKGRPTFHGYSIVEDLGVVRSNFGNAAGGRFPGLYRFVRVRTPRGRDHFCCLAVSGYYTGRNLSKFCMAILGGVDGRQSLQVQSWHPANRFSPEEAALYHRGYVSLGEGARIAGTWVRKAVASHCPSLLKEEGILAARISSATRKPAQLRKLVLRLTVLSIVLDGVRTAARRRRRRAAAAHD